MKKFLPFLLLIIMPSLAMSQYTDYFRYQKPLLQIISNIALDSVMKVDLRKLRLNKIAAVTVTDQTGKQVEYYVYNEKGNIAQYYQFDDTMKFTYDKLGKIVYSVLDSFPKNIYESETFNYDSYGNLEDIDRTFNGVKPDIKIEFTTENKLVKSIVGQKEDSDFRKQYNFVYEAINNQVKQFSVANVGVDEIGDSQFRLEYNPQGKLLNVNFADKNMSFVTVRYNGDTVHISPNENVYDPVNGLGPLDQVFYVIQNQRIKSKITLFKISNYNVMRVAEYFYTTQGVIDYINVNYVCYRGVIRTEKLNYTYELKEQ